MKLLLLQDEIYLPSLAGGTKANRYLLEGLARNGHECLAVTPALTRSPDGPNNQMAFMQELTTRGITFSATEPHVFTYQYQGVHVEAMNPLPPDISHDYVVRRIKKFQPDWILVNEDKRRFMLEGALHAMPERVLLLIQTIVQLPFGPLAVQASQKQTELMGQARAMIVISRFLQEYIHEHSKLKPRLMPLPVYGEGPYPKLGRFDEGYVTMINPCELKGLSIFVALSKEHPDVEFAAVPTWGANEEIQSQLEALPNVRILKAADNIEEILAQTKVLLVPSLWPETFGYVVPEAMLRGIPVIASNVGGLPEAKLGVDYVLPVVPAERHNNGYVSPSQDIKPWSKALGELLSDSEAYDRYSRQSQEAALKFVSGLSLNSFEEFLTELTLR